MLMLTVFTACLLSVVLAGGHIRGLARLEFRAGWLCGLALVVQVLVISVLPETRFSEAGHIASYVLIAGFLVANHHLPGLKLIALGAVMNFAAISVNGGVMPARQGALEAAGMADNVAASEEFANSMAQEGARLSFLGDVFALPEPWVFANVFSAGDVVIAVGAAVAMHATCQSRLSRSRRRQHPSPVAAPSMVSFDVVGGHAVRIAARRAGDVVAARQAQLVLF